MEYKKWQDAVSLGQEQYVQLSLPTAEKAGATPGSASEADLTASSGTGAAAAADLIAQADKLMGEHQLEAAQKALDQARDLNPKSNGLWNAYGFLAFSRGNMADAMQDYHKELDLHPGDAWAYQQLSSLQLTTNKHAEAAETLRSWSLADPNDARPVMSKMSMLLDEEKPAEAVSAGRSGLAHLNPENTRLQEVQVVLGRAQIKAGDLQGADATLTPLLSGSKPFLLNEAAYTLADANLELPAAESAERVALKQLDAETASWTLHESSATLTQTSRLLVASWDTMGWILFREGKLAEALAYLQAAHRNSHTWVVSEHLGDIELKQLHPAKALAAYEEAERLLPRVDAMGVRKNPGQAGVELEGKIAHLKPSIGTPALLVDPSAQAARTFPLGPANGRTMTAEYSLLLSRSKVEAFDEVAGKDIANAASLLAGFKTEEFFPPESQARLVKFGFLNCHGAICELILRP